MLQNAYFLAKIGADTAENEQHFAEILPIGRRVADRSRLQNVVAGLELHDVGRGAGLAPVCGGHLRWLSDGTNWEN